MSKQLQRDKLSAAGGAVRCKPGPSGGRADWHFVSPCGKAFNSVASAIAFADRLSSVCASSSVPPVVASAGPSTPPRVCASSSAHTAKGYKSIRI